jgi:hypothetical protein
MCSGWTILEDYILEAVCGESALMLLIGAGDQPGAVRCVDTVSLTMPVCGLEIVQNSLRVSNRGQVCKL